MKVFAFGVMVLAASASFAQQSKGLELGDAKAIDIHASEVTWHPNGLSFLYNRETEDGRSLGTYCLDKKEGKALLPLDKDETYDVYWLSNSNSAIVVLSVKATGTQQPSTRIRMVLVDATLQTTKPLYNETFENKSLPSVDVDQSPLLRHAIVTLRNTTGVRHMVLCLGDARLVDAPDLDRAEKEGLSGPSWSVDGTAIYSNSPARSLLGSKIVVNDALLDSQKATDQTSSQSKEELRQITLDVVEVKGLLVSSSSGKEFRFKIMPPTPATGANVLELMPSNAVLRPVRFRGPWQPVNSGREPLIPRNQSVVLQFDRSNAQDNSVWIKRGTQAGTPATLLGVHVSQTWLSPNQNAVAYLIDGALFVRTIR